MEGTGLVLAGGGGKGIYQVGVLKSLAEAGLLDDIVAVSGTSIGGVNAVLFAEGLAEGGMEHAMEQMQQTWDDIDFNVFFNVDNADIQAGSNHFSRRATENLIDKYLTYDLFTEQTELDQRPRCMPVILTAAKCPPNVVTTEHITEEEMRLLYSADVNETYRDYTVEYMKINETSRDYIKNAILATTALPVIYNPVSIDGSLYIDGGVKDNVPIKPLYDMGIRRFIVIELGNSCAIKDIENYSDAEIIDIIPSKDLGSLLSGTMNFDREDKRLKQYIGEFDGKRYIKTLFEKDEAYIAVAASLAEMDYQQAKQKIEFERKYSSLNGSVNRNFDYIDKLEQKLKKYDDF